MKLPKLVWDNKHECFESVFNEGLKDEIFLFFHVDENSKEIKNYAIIHYNSNELAEGRHRNIVMSVEMLNAIHKLLKKANKMYQKIKNEKNINNGSFNRND